MPITNFFKKDPLTQSTSIGAIVDGFKYNLELVPDILLVTIGLFAILLQNAPLTALGASLLSVNIFQPLLDKYFKEVVPSTWGVSTRVTGRFPGFSAERLSTKQSLNPAEIPSYYTTFVGTFLGWVAFLPLFYQPELSISAQRMLSSNLSSAFIAIFGTILLIYRYLSSQDTALGILLGVGLGGIFGFLIMLALYYMTQRRITNLYNFPLLSTSYGGTKDGKPIYVCSTAAPVKVAAAALAAVTTAAAAPAAAPASPAARAAAAAASVRRGDQVRPATAST
jgi:hypothetical protein